MSCLRTLVSCSGAAGVLERVLWDRCATPSAPQYTQLDLKSPLPSAELSHLDELMP